MIGGTMDYELQKTKRARWWAFMWITITFMILFSIYALMRYYPQYRVYAQTLRGQADFAEAEINRQILVEEAKANEEALQLNANGEAQRERIRADATAYAGEKVGAMLEANPGYLRWLWINNVAGSKGERIYIATEAGLPILEAGK